jgi:hypothetical protein
MRLGFNPNKDKKIETSEYFHQVIIPIYIPNEGGYFKDSFQILKYCLQSLFKTSHSKTFFTIVNNGSCKEVVAYLNSLHKKGEIHEIIHTSAIGKLNAILKGLVGHQFPLITISDADVLFLNNWQSESYKVFEHFPKAGVVSTTPNSKLLRYLTSNIIVEKGISNQLAFTKVVNPVAMKAFANSIENPSLFNKCHLEKYLTITSDNVKAVIGAGHFVATYRADIFNNLKEKTSNYSLGGESEKLILDKPVVDKGYWRLSTQDNFTYHMGNIMEDWMLETLECQTPEELEVLLPNLIKIKKIRIVNYIKNTIFAKIIYKRFLWKRFLLLKGLSKDESKKY